MSNDQPKPIIPPGQLRREAATRRRKTRGAFGKPRHTRLQKGGQS